VFDDWERLWLKVCISSCNAIFSTTQVKISDRRVKIREIANIIKISTEHIQNVLHETLGMKKLSAMDAAFAHSGTKTESHDNFKALFEHV